MVAKTPKFQSQSPFFEELKTKIQEYFQEKKIERSGGLRLFFKALFLVAILVTAYLCLIIGKPDLGLSLVFWALLSFATITIGFNVMHDGSHGSFSDNKFLNNLAAWSLSILGGSAQMWYMKHTVIHHTYTNIDGIDDDIDIQPFMRMSESQKKYKFHRFQHIYALVMYASLYLLWIFFLDINKYFKKKIGLVTLPKMKWYQHVSFWAVKIFHIVFFIIIPLNALGLVNFIIGYLMFTLITGLVVSIVFQLAHTVEDTAFPTIPDNNRMELDWATHQVITTANFATKSRLVSWLVGGLNFQVEHHLFPNISHIHYPKIHPIVKSVCAKYGIEYHEHKTVMNAVISHLKYLRQMGKN